jgi:osmotically-inducible protein OsmY
LYTEMLHGDVIVGMSVYDELHHELGEASDAEMSGYPSGRRLRLADDDDGAWGAGCLQTAGREAERDVASRDDGEVRKDVLRALLLDSLVPLTVDAQVSDGVVTLTGTAGSEHERTDATFLAGRVPGVVGVLDHMVPRPRPPDDDDDEAIRDAVASALACTAIADVADLTVGSAGWGTVVLSGAVHSHGDHDLAIATAWSVADVGAVEDCIQVEADT